MTYRILIPAFLLLFTCRLSAQQGDLFLTHHTLDIEGLDNTNFEIEFDSKGQMYMANRSGVLTYDGSHWDYISTPSAALSLAFDEHDNLYVGCVGDFGRIEIKDRKYQFVSLNPNQDDDGIYFKTVFRDSSVYFMSEESLLRHHVLQGKTNVFYLDNPDEYFNNLFVIDSTLQVQTSDSLYLYQGDSLAQTHIVKPDSSSFLFFNRHPNRERYVVGTTDNKTYIYRKKQFFECKISDFLNENESFVVNGKWLNWKYFALSTLENGTIVYDNRNSKIVEVINQSKGLPDNQIQAIGVDKEEGLWISHEFGLTRMEIGIPFRSFTNFPGLRGHIFEVFFFNRHLYVATSEGVFHLEKEDIYETTVYYVEKSSSRSKTTAKTEAKPDPEPQSQKRRKGLLGKIFSSKEDSPTDKPTATIPKAFALKKKKSYERRLRKRLVDSKWVFKQVEGIRSKTEKFIVYQNKLFVAGVSGVYQIEKNVAELVIHEPVRFVIKDEKANHLILGTLYNEIKIFDLEGDVWTESEDLNLHGGRVMTAMHDQSGRTWFVTPTSLLEFEDFSKDHMVYNTYKYKNQFIDDVKLSYIDKQLYLINSEGYFYLHTGLKKMVEDTVLRQQIGRPVKHLQERNGIVWVFNGQNWYMIHRDKSVQEMDMFGLFPDMSYVSYFGNNHWLIDNSEQILQYVPAIADSLISKNKMFIKKVSNNMGDVPLASSMSFDYDERSVRFEMSRPDYRGILKPEYQYKLAGMSDEWSNWSNDNTFEFFLAPARYELSVRLRDAFGNIEEADSINFVVHPPFWQTLWFNALQILFLAGLVIVSIVMNRRAKTKYVIVTEGLTILTIVLVIEFLQTVAGNYLDIQSSYLIDFGVDVMIALFVFPLEQGLKKLMKADKIGPGISGKGIFDFLRPAKA